jgi:hypothetical protein
MNHGGRLCILMPTCARYEAVGRLTLEQIGVSWDDHPPVFVCGVDSEPALELRDDPRDWMSVTRSAVSDLAGRGFRWVYLILDDHPPTGPCRSEILNRLLPAYAVELGATNIGLLGWGQRRAREGVDLGPSFRHLARNDPSYRWKFSLHPALWSVEGLLRLLDVRLGQFPPGERTPWNFERHRDTADGPVPRELLAGTYRIHGASMVSWVGRAGIACKEAGLFGYDVLRFVLRVGCGQAARDRFDREGLWLYHVYSGPYPVFWSGVIRGGVPSPEFAIFQRLMARSGMLPAWGGVGERFAGR